MGYALQDDGHGSLAATTMLMWVVSSWAMLLLHLLQSNRETCGVRKLDAVHEAEANGAS